MEQMVCPTCIRIRDENIFITVIVVISHRHGGAAGGKHAKNISVFAMKPARVVLGADSGPGADLFKASYGFCVLCGPRASESAEYSQRETNPDRT
jgi:hypothetical protein